jgi:fructose-1-phosphate kinase PfkB-like protein
MKKNIASLATQEKSVNVENNQLLTYLEKAQNEIFMIMALGSFPRYLKSDIYQQWVKSTSQSDTRIAEKTK